MKSNRELISLKVKEYINDIRIALEKIWDIIQYDPAILEWGIVGLAFGGKKGAVIVGGLAHMVKWAQNLSKALGLASAGVISLKDIATANFKELEALVNDFDTKAAGKNYPYLPIYTDQKGPGKPKKEEEEGLEDSYEIITKKQNAWLAGARQAFDSYSQYATDAAENARTAMTGALFNAEDALVNFVKTGKLNFADLANSIINDLIRIAVRAMLTGIVMQAFGFSGGGTVHIGAGGTTAFGMAEGGVIREHIWGVGQSGRRYEFGERGPEYVIPQNKMSSGSGAYVLNTTINVEVAGSAGADHEETLKNGAMISTAIKAEFEKFLVDNLRPGGLLNRRVA